MRLKISLYWNIRHSNISLTNDKISLLLVVGIGALWSRFSKVKIVYCAEAAARSHIRMGYPNKRYTVIGNGYQKYPHPLPDLHLNKSSEDIFKIGYFGRYHPQKNHRKLFEAIAVLKDTINIQLLLVGKDCEHTNKELVQTLKNMGIKHNVILKGLISEPRSLMHECDYTVLVSDYGEGFPNVLGESLSVGTPCISTDVGDASLILKTSGKVVKKRSLEDLIRQLRAAWEVRRSLPSYQRLRCNSIKNFYQHLTVDKMVNNYIDVWTDKVKF